MGWIDVLNAAMGISSLALGGFAIWLSWQFYSKTKDSEIATSNALTAIKTQAESLQTLTAKWMDRFTKHAVTPKPADEALIQLVQVIANIPQKYSQTQYLGIPSSPSSGVASHSNEVLRKEVVDCYIVLYHYTAMANALAQLSLPSLESFDASNGFHKHIQSIVENTARDFQLIVKAMGAITEAEIKASKAKTLYDETAASWEPYVRVSHEVWKLREKEAA